MEESDEQVSLKHHQKRSKRNADDGGREAQAIILQVSPGEPHGVGSTASQTARLWPKQFALPLIRISAESACAADYIRDRAGGVLEIAA